MSKLQSFEPVSVKGEMPYKVTYKRYLYRYYGLSVRGVIG